METNQHDEADTHAGDLLIGAAAIRDYLILLGMPEKTADPYYLKRSRNLPIGNTAGDSGLLITSKTRLKRRLAELARGSTAA